MMSMGLGTGAALGGLGGINPYGDLSGGGGGVVAPNARHGHFRTSSGRYEDPYASGIDLSYWSAQDIQTAKANYENQQRAEGLPPGASTFINGTTWGGQTQYSLQGMEKNTAQTATGIYESIIAANANTDRLITALSDSDSGGGSGKGKNKIDRTSYNAGQYYASLPDTYHSMVPGFARGVDFLTPAGSSNDRYPFMALLSGNERVKIMPNGRDSTGVVMVSKAVNIGDVNINSGMDLAMFRTMLARALAT